MLMSQENNEKLSLKKGACPHQARMMHWAKFSTTPIALGQVLNQPHCKAKSFVIDTLEFMPWLHTFLRELKAYHKQLREG